MALDKAIIYNKEHRKQYYGNKAIDKTCRNGGTCIYCQINRQYKNIKRLVNMVDKLNDLCYN